ncbi:NACHT domain-containing protein [Sphingorhabdus sp.]|uniref:NACHT domain-containing protein n=1 Tax=Sphingorhabdus sp. TaxID=1902408 RepID=UPI002FDAB6B5
MKSQIKRRLAKYDSKTSEWQFIDQQDILSLNDPIVILGDPGLGKSVLAEVLGQQPGQTYVRAGTFVRSAHPETYLTPGGRLVIDGLDEVASTAIGGGVEAVLAQLSKIGNPPFILSSREADWRGAADRIKIEDDYAGKPVLLHLQHFDRDDARTFLAENFSTVDGDAILDHLSARGLEDIYKNPLTLKLMGEVAAADGALPNSRAQLFDRACRVMLKEENPRHQDAGHVQCSEDELLLAAGAHCAVQLLCDRIGVFTGPFAQTPDGFNHLSEIVGLPLAKAAEDALRTRLFQADGENRLIPAHRVIAEYLGAKWLAACFESGISERRIFGLFSQGDGAPTSLRGLHAWIAHFNDVLAERCIITDPYGVLRYGDAETLPLSQARSLLRELAKLSEDDPYFRAEDWGRHPASGLLRAELKDDILAIIGTPDRHTHLTLLLLDAMEGSDLTTALGPDVESMIFDRARYFAERSSAADALRAANALGDLEAVIYRLLGLGDEDSNRLASELLQDVGIGRVPAALAVETMLAHIGLTVRPIDGDDEDRLSIAHIGSKVFADLGSHQTAQALDLLADYSAPLMRDAAHSAKEQVADLVRLGAVHALEVGGSVSPEQMWRWVGWLRGEEGYSHDTTARLATMIRERTDLGRGIQALRLLTPPEDARLASYRLARTGLNLQPDDTDLIALLREYDRQRASGPLNIEQLSALVGLGRYKDGLAESVRLVAAEIAAGDVSFLALLDDWAKPIVYEYEAKQAARTAEEEARRKAVYQSVREDHTKRADEIAAGHVNLLYDPARAYLGRFNEFGREDAPEARVKAFLGDDLGDRALDGFIATLRRDDLPTAEQIAESHADNKHWYAEEPMICGVAELVRREISLTTVPRIALEAAFMAWRRATESNYKNKLDISATFEAAVLPDEAATEAFFRKSIEPELERRAGHVRDLYRLAHEPRWEKLAGKLAVEWLQRFPSLPDSVEAELLDCAVRNASRDDLRGVVIASRDRVHASYDRMLTWLAADFVVDFEVAREHVTEAGSDDPDFFWFIRNRVAGERRDALQSLSVAQRALLIEVFGTSFPKTSHPQGSSSGNSNPWDASDFLDRMIYAIASEPSAEATETLQRLILEAAPSYVDPMRHALALQRKARRDHEYVAPSVSHLQAVMANALPDSVDDMRAYFGDRISVLQDRMHGTNTDMWEAYWDGAKPRGENFCRNRLIEHISGQLPEAIRFEPEMHMPGQKRADIAVIRNSIGLPVEIKGQWHKEVWNAPMEQLAALYARDWHAEGRGVYIVMWFGSVSGKQLPRHPDGLDAPKTSQELQLMLVDRLPEAQRSLIDIYVVDVSRLPK